MDPITIVAVANAAEAVAVMVTEIVRGQPLEMKAQAWEWWVKDWARVRKALGLDD